MVSGGAAAVEVDKVSAVVRASLEVPVDEVLDVDESVDAAGDGDGALLLEAVLALRLLEQRTEERVLEVEQRHREPPLLLPLLAHPHHHAPLGRHHRPRRGRATARRLQLLLDVHQESTQSSKGKRGRRLAS